MAGREERIDVRRLVLVILATAAVCPAFGAELVLTVSRPGDGLWEVYGQLDNNTDNDGLASLIIDVSPAGGEVAIASSQCDLPFGTHYYLDGLDVMSEPVGFHQYRSDGLLGTGILAGQGTLQADSVVLVDVGFSAGSTAGDETGQALGPETIDWAAPVLIASGSFSGEYGYIDVAVGDGQINVLDEGRDPMQLGQVHQIETVVEAHFQVLYPGDASGDNHVGVGDLSIMAGNWNQSGFTNGYADADFNYDGAVSLGDLSVMAATWDWSAPVAAPIGIPEPATVSLLALGAVGLLAPRRRKHRETT